MANIKSAKKRILVTETRAERNKAIRSGVKTVVKKVYAAIEDIINGFAADRFADTEFWYEYWKAAYEAAIAFISQDSPVFGDPDISCAVAIIPTMEAQKPENA